MDKGRDFCLPIGKAFPCTSKCSFALQKGTFNSEKATFYL